MKLLVPTSENLAEMMSWFEDEQQLITWSGHNFRYPFDEVTFTEDLKLDSIESFVLISDNFQLLAFGQCYLREGRCHLGRLVVAPKFRGKGIVIELITLLAEHGIKKFNAIECSLFVFEENTSAINAYQRIGFNFTDYPEVIPIEDCLYMVKRY